MSSFFDCLFALSEFINEYSSIGYDANSISLKKLKESFIKLSKGQQDQIISIVHSDSFLVNILTQVSDETENTS